MVINDKIIFALPKGRILKELLPLLSKIGVEIEEDFLNESSRKLYFETNIKNLFIIKCRSFDIATFAAFGGADIAICGLDVIKEFGYNNLYRALNLDIAKCKLSLAYSKDFQDRKNKGSIKVATKYPNLTRQFFEKKFLQSEIIKLNGSIELAAKLKLSDCIVDLVSTGNTLKANNLIESEKIIDISSYFIINKESYRKNLNFLNLFINKLKKAV